MAKIKIVTDSASDVSFKHEDLYDIEVIPFGIELSDETFVSRQDFDNAKFYEMMEEADLLPTVSPISSFDFGELYYELLDQGYTDVICVSVCSKGSETYYNAVQARDQFFEDNPDAKATMNIYCVDSRTYSAGYGYAVVEAAKMADRGKDASDIVKFLRDWFDSCVIYLGLYSLKNAKKSSVIDLDSAFVGELIGFRPILEARAGQITTEATVRRESAIVPFLSELCAEEIQEGSPYCIIYGEDADRKDELAGLLTKTLGYAPADVYQVGAATACHTGTETVGVVFKSK